MIQSIQKRRKRYEREPVGRFQLTGQDVNILKLVYQNRFLASSHIVALMGKNRKSILRRLQLLFHTGYLDRPKAQVTTHGYNSPMVYALGNRGAEVLAVEYDDESILRINWTEKNKNAKTMFLEHSLMVSEFLTVVRRACERVRGAEFIPPEEIIKNRVNPPSDPANPLSWQVGGKNKGYCFSMIPDSAFGLRIMDETTGRQGIVYYFLEADRATMPVVRHNLFRSSIYKKIKGYTASHEERLFSQNFGFKKVFVLMLTLSYERINNMIKLNQQINPRAQGLFKFAEYSTAVNLDRPEYVLGLAWTDGKGRTGNMIE